MRFIKAIQRYRWNLFKYNVLMRCAGIGFSMDSNMRFMHEANCHDRCAKRILKLVIMKDIAAFAIMLAVTVGLVLLTVYVVSLW